VTYIYNQHKAPWQAIHGVSRATRLTTTLDLGQEFLAIGSLGGRAGTPGAPIGR